MSIRRLLLTAAAMAAVAVALTALTPAFPAMAEAMADPQGTVDRAGADTLVLAGAGLLAWLCWAWGAVGLALTAASALPGLLGSIARAGLYVVLPAGARRSAALLLGLGLGVAGPLVGTLSPSVPTAAAAVGDGTPGPADWSNIERSDRPGGTVPDRPNGAVPDWPAPVLSRAADDAVPDWPGAPAPDTAPAHPLGAHVVLRGDCLWSIAEARLLDAGGRAPSASEVAAAVHDWWSTNRAVIGPDPDRLLPGQVLQPPP
jgi:hypothetical protein